MDTDRRAQWLRGVIDLCVLGALRDGESYGYEIARRLEAAGLGPVPGGTLYPVLLRLEKTGHVTADWRAGAGGPARKYYRISPQGRQTLADAGADWRRFTAGAGALMTGVATP
ncbi:PadR family transcriptional regulator [Spirilliplanes yamanashiensis]|uniref:PadR family transcriptional regulator n=1 Tax=Spirilliplanes yamanashiensis TaxID=42233 RepID=A0A8J4DGY4_9ACTN|nr:PadR family transcriptional regulator [Spirilliplanes yamanashiensis]MDP9819471.1 PadR family transcriptional regulator PadR [Spirilliplanes yamanashiensis]GIJ01707.1 PadR family transcriptional regulator [Spirilliplanes yamanashiensis]